MGVMGFLALFGILAWVLFQVVGGLAGIIYYTGRFFTSKKREHKEQVELIEEAYSKLQGKAVRFKRAFYEMLEDSGDWTVYHIIGLNEDHTALVTEEGMEITKPEVFEIVVEAKTR